MPRVRPLLALPAVLVLTLGLLPAAEPASAQRVVLVEEFGFFT